jgi:predicted ATPase
VQAKRFIRKLQLRNFLSYGSNNEAIELEPLNVLIGRNGSGKSNLIEAISMLKATPVDLMAPIRKGGGIADFLWKGEPNPVAEIDAVVEDHERQISLRYHLSFTMSGQRLEIVDEAIDNNRSGLEENQPDFFYRYQQGRPEITIKSAAESLRIKRYLSQENVSQNQSILSQIKDPDLYPELSYIGSQFSRIAIYRNWEIGQESIPRLPQKTDLPEHPLWEDGSNLGLVLNNLQNQIGSRKMVEMLQKFYDEAEELSLKIYGGTVQILIREKGLIQPIPANRLSDGTLRYLFLMALLLDPTPPPVLCIEEPEIGFHPDILPMVAEMLISASQKTQLIVTTHSDALVSALNPESVLVCDRDDRGSNLRRLDPERLKKWLDNYTLGDLWLMGEIGGDRW